MHYIIKNQRKYFVEYVTAGWGEPAAVTAKAIWSINQPGAKRFQTVDEAERFRKDYYVSRRAQIIRIHE